MPNRLIHATSPYLLQHAHNPVDWFPWGEEALQTAQTADKPILVSIGYSACHWCHVMEHECFENDQLAALMNQYFVCIKVDREERPDIDNLYMSAVQLMTGRGGWPLNCFALPDGRPIYGGTYFNAQQWQNVLESIAESWKNNKERTIEYAVKLQQGIVTSDMHFASETTVEYKQLLRDAMFNWQTRFDTVYGGPNKEPKFPIPVNYTFLLRYAHITRDEKIQAHVELTLKKMAMGGIYDQLAGGFARYSVDGLWKVPHFEKMLYDNAQLISLYAEAFSATTNIYYKRIANEIIDFAIQNWQTNDGLFCSAFDADTDGVEGKYYVWTKAELENIFKEHFDAEQFQEFSKIYSLDKYGYWEHENYVLQQQHSLDELGIVNNAFKIESWKKVLLQYRGKRTAPLLDDKQLTSWNAMMCKALADSALRFENHDLLAHSIKCYEAIKSLLSKPNHKLWRTYKNGKAHIDAFLEDYAFCIEAALALYKSTFNQEYLNDAEQWLSICFSDFSKADSPLFYYTDANAEKLAARLTDLQDNVIAASNSSLANSLFVLSHLTSNQNYAAQAKAMCNYAIPHLVDYPEAYSNWCNLLLMMDTDFHEIIVTGKAAFITANQLQKQYIPNAIIAATEIINDSLEIFKNRVDENKLQLFICTNNVCSLPFNNVDDVINFLKK
jgi:uncharacterized protein YyaL (SSP411 family)